MPAFDNPAMQIDGTVNAKLEAHLALSRSPRVGSLTFQRLVARYGDAETALYNLPEHATRKGIRSYRPVDMACVRLELKCASECGAIPLMLGADNYPAQLSSIADPPPLLWAIGDCTLLEKPITALVGARNASALGQRMSAQLARELGEMGHVIASGLARGIDTAAHEASLETGTIAVLAGGIDVIYPTSNISLAAKIAKKGLLLSEAPMGTQPIARHFPKRNRIISGVSNAIILVEAAERSGSLITARMALEQGRDVMAIPGHPLDPRAAGCNRLIREGAALVRSAEDISENLAMPVAHNTNFHTETGEWTGPELLPNQTHQMLASLISAAPVSEDELIRALGAPVSTVLAALTDLELSGQIDRHSGGMVSRRM